MLELARDTPPDPMAPAGRGTEKGTRLMSDITDVSSYVKLSQRLKSAMRPLLLELLQGGVSVVLDFPAISPDQI